MTRCNRGGWLVGRSLAPLVVVAVVAMGCSDDDPRSDPSPGFDDPLAFSDDPVRLGFVNTEGGALPLPEFRVGAEVAAGVLNGDGGIRGAPIELVPCAVDGTAESSVACARRLVADGVVGVVVGFDPSSDAMLGALEAAGIPFVGVNSTGPAQRADPDATVLHSATRAFDVGPLAWFERSGLSTVGVVAPDDAAGRRYVATVADGIAESDLGLDVVDAYVDPERPDFLGALRRLAGAGVDAIHAQVDDVGCLGLIDAVRAAGYDRPVVAGACELHLEVAPDVAVGTYVQADIFTPRARADAGDVIGERLDRYVEAMSAAGHGGSVDGFAADTYGAMFELAEILRRTDQPITAAGFAAALDEPVDTPGWFGPDLHCGQAPVPDEPRHCRGDVAVFEVTDLDGDGHVELDLVAPFFDPLDGTG